MPEKRAKFAAEIAITVRLPVATQEEAQAACMKITERMSRFVEQDNIKQITVNGYEILERKETSEDETQTEEQEVQFWSFEE